MTKDNELRLKFAQLKLDHCKLKEVVKEQGKRITLLEEEVRILKAKDKIEKVKDSRIRRVDPW